MNTITDAVFKFLIYEPTWKIIVLCVGIDVLWNVIHFVTNKQGKLKRIIYGFFLFLTLAVVFWITLLSRHPQVQEYCIKPFTLIEQAKNQPTIYRSIMMNIFLFIPFGLCVPEIISEISWCKELVIVCGCFLLSSFIEIMQFLYCLGRAEVDDVISNTFGALIGILLYHINKKVMEKISSIK